MRYQNFRTIAYNTILFNRNLNYRWIPVFASLSKTKIYRRHSYATNSEKQEIHNNSVNFWQAHSAAPSHFNAEHWDMRKCVDEAEKNIFSILKTSIKIEPHEYQLPENDGDFTAVNEARNGDELNRGNLRVVVVYDLNSLLSRVLANAYEKVLKGTCAFSMLQFDQYAAKSLISVFESLAVGDLVVCIQSTNFRLNDYRLRLELFKRGIKVIEHVHLSMMKSVEQVETYVESLYLVPCEKVKRMATHIKHKLDGCKRVVVRSKNGSECIYDTEMEMCLLNIGDYQGQNNVGGTFPIGEVFTEPKNLSRVNGEMEVFAYPDKNHELVILDQSFRVKVEQGKLVWVEESAPKSFFEVLEIIRAVESEDDRGSVLLREFGLGINEKISRYKPISNPIAFERQAGFHVSLGRKHTVFKKSSISHKKSRFHIDIFIDLDCIDVDGHKIYADGKFVQPSSL